MFILGKKAKPYCLALDKFVSKCLWGIMAFLQMVEYNALGNDAKRLGSVFFFFINMS